MTRTFKVTMPMILAAVALLAIAGGALIYAFTLAQLDRNTGAFTISAESTAIEVLTFNGVTPVTTTWCERPGLVVGDSWYCAATIKNLKTSGPIHIGITTLSVVDTDGLHLATKLVLGAEIVNSLSDCGLNAGAPTGIGPTDALDSLPGFAVSPGITIAALATKIACFHYAYPATGTPIYSASTGASFRVTASDQ